MRLKKEKKDDWIGVSKIAEGLERMESNKEEERYERKKKKRRTKKKKNVWLTD